MRNILKKLLGWCVATAVVVGMLASFNPALAQNIVTSSGVWRRSGTSMLLNPSTLHIGSTSSRIAKGWFTDLDVSGVLTFGGALTGSLDLDGNSLIMDADADTSLTADTDDQIDVEVGGADIALFTADGLGVDELFNVTSADNALIDLAATGAKVSRNIADAGVAFVIDQEHASSTGNILELHDESVSILDFNQDVQIIFPQNGASMTSSTDTAIARDDVGDLTLNAPSGNAVDIRNNGTFIGSFSANGLTIDTLFGSNSVNNGRLIFATNDTTLERNKGDDKPVFIVDQRHASSTGNILELHDGSSADISFSLDSEIMFEATGVAVTAADTVISRNDNDDMAFNVPTSQMFSFSVNGSEVFSVDGSTAIFSTRVLEAQGSDVASANDITLGTDGNYFDITGTTQINRIATADWEAGASFFLQFDGSLTVKDNQAAGGGFGSILITGSTDYASSAGSVLQCVFDGASFRCSPFFTE